MRHGSSWMSVCGLLLLALAQTSCKSHQAAVSPRLEAIARAGIALGVTVEEHDNHALFLEAASWLGSPYRLGGNTRQGVDCSGLSCAIYHKVFRTELHRRSEDQYKRDARRIRRGELRQGDLVFFTTPGSRGKCGHVGIFLKGDRFIHAGRSGVVVESLDLDYWKRHWLSGGRAAK